MSKATELFELDDDELQNRVAASRRELLNLRFQLATGQLDNTQRLSDVKRDIARALTVLRSRDLYEVDVELEPLVLTPVRRPALDTSGGIDEDAVVEDEVEDEEEGEAGDVDDATESFTDDADVDDYDEDDVDAELDEEALDEHEASAELPDESGEPGGDDDASDDATEEDG